jgi:hypothetical protein
VKRSSEPRPLLIAADERDREIALQCATVEAACRAIGWRAGSKVERVAVLVARLVGRGELRATLDRIAADLGVGCTARHVARCLERLEEFGVLTVEAEPSPPWRRVGRPPVLYRLGVAWGYVRDLVAESRAWEESMRATAADPSRQRIETPAAESTQPANDPKPPVGQFPTSVRRVPDACPTSARQVPDHCSTSARHSGTTPSYTQVPNNLPPPPPQRATGSSERAAAAEIGNPELDWTAAEAAVRAAGVEGWARCVDAARANGYTPAELIDDAYVVAHCDRIKPGALFYRVTDRGRCWPASGVPEAATLRHERGKRADAIRKATAADAPANAKYGAVAAVTVKRLRAAGLDEFVTDAELATWERIEAARQQKTQTVGADA